MELKNKFNICITLYYNNTKYIFKKHSQIFQTNEMPRIRLQKSRLNSLVCNDDLDEERSFGYEDLSDEGLDEIPTTIPEETEDKQPTRPLTRYN